MENLKTRIFLTGATGVMGEAALKEFSKYPSNYDITVLVRPSKKNKKKIKKNLREGVKVVCGDLLDPEALKQGVEKSDIVLHVGGMVSPRADHFPLETLRVNIGSMKLIADIVKNIELNNPQREIKVVYIGSVAQYGSKLPPDHWGKAGDIMKTAVFDAYAVSKILAERALLEAGLKKWVSIRQTGILHAGLLKKANDPITFHFPIQGVLEWISAEESGRLLERICRPEVPEDFWCCVYNAGSGKKLRLTNLEFERGILKALGCPPPEKIFETKWFATDNFHGFWFKDSDLLDQILHFRENLSFEEVLKRLKKSMPFYYKLSPLAPAFLIKAFMKKVALTPQLGPLWWLQNNQEEKIKYCWGSRENYNNIPTWEEMEEKDLNRNSSYLSSAPRKKYSTFLREKICNKGHTYFSSDVLEGYGHTCPVCMIKASKVELPEEMTL
ncbi:MAG: NAD(P)-dependent oxidoreductase [Muribaculaceae bacterium]|nr:NAD(P)-dependent oxidoreductase [Muribaculaceae bacterium]